MIWRKGWIDALNTTPNPQPSKVVVLPKTFLQFILATQWFVRHSSLSLNQQRRPLPSLYIYPSSLFWVNLVCLLSRLTLYQWAITSLNFVCQATLEEKNRNNSMSININYWGGVKIWIVGILMIYDFTSPHQWIFMKHCFLIFFLKVYTYIYLYVIASWAVRFVHRRRIHTEDKAKVVAAVWSNSIYSIPCCAIAVFNRMIWKKGLIRPGWYEEKTEFILIFKSSWWKIASAARNWIILSPK